MNKEHLYWYLYCIFGVGFSYILKYIDMPLISNIFSPLLFITYSLVFVFLLYEDLRLNGGNIYQWLHRNYYLAFRKSKCVKLEFENGDFEYGTFLDTYKSGKLISLGKGWFKIIE